MPTVCAKLLLLTIVLIFPLCAARAADAPAAAPTQRQVDSWISQLDADTRKDRTAAERALVDAGPAVLPLLPPPERLSSTPLREAVRRIRLQLERDKARANVKAKRVNLDAKQPLSATLKELEKQSGNALNLSRLPADLMRLSVYVQWDRQDYWPAVNELCKQARLQVAVRDGRVSLIEKPEKDEPPATSHHGPFHITVMSISLRPLFGDDARQLVRVKLRVLPEPRLRGLFLKFDGKSLAMKIGDNTLPPFNPDAKYELPIAEQHGVVESSFDFIAPKLLADDELQLTGKMAMTVAAGSEEIGFSKLNSAAGTIRRKGGVTISLQDFDWEDRATGDGHRARVGIAVSYDTGGPAFESHRTWVFHNRAYLQAAEGARLEKNDKFTTTLQQNGATGIEYEFDGVRGPVDDLRFVYIAPTLIINAPINLRFDSLPLSRR